jgi:hypothetical protein
MKTKVAIGFLLLGLMFSFSPEIQAEVPTKKEIEEAEKSFFKAYEAITGKGGVIDSTPSESISEKKMIEPVNTNGHDDYIVEIPSQGKVAAEQALKFWVKQDIKGFNSLLWNDVTMCGDETPGIGKKAITTQSDSKKIISSQYLYSENLLKAISPVLEKIRLGGVKFVHLRNRLKLAKDDFFFFAQFGNNDTEEVLILGLQKRKEDYKVSYIEF